MWIKVILILLLALCYASVGTAWAGSFSIDSAGAALVKLSQLYSFSGGNDQYGAATTSQCGSNTSGRYLRAPIQFPTLIDTLRILDAGTVIDSGFICFVISSVASLSAGSSVPDTLGVSLNKITTLWDEGDRTGTNQGAGVRYDSASATGTSGGNNPNAPLDWTDGGDFEANPEYNDTTFLVGGVAAVFDTVRLKVEGTSLADTTTDYGYMIYGAYIADGDDGGTGCAITFRTDDYSVLNQQAYLEVYHSPGDGADTYEGQVIIIGGG